MSAHNPKAFVLMPFAPAFDDIYERFLRPTLAERGFEVKRADDIMNQQNILRDVIDWIVACDLIIADLTGANPNVFYEVGIAHTMSKPVILITQDRDDVPFDLRQYRILEYSRDFASIEDAKASLAQYAKQFLQGEISFGNPVSDFRQVNTVQQEPFLPVTVVETDTNAQGYLDHVVLFTEGYESLSESLLSIIPYAHEVEAKLAAVTDDITITMSNPDSSTYRVLRNKFNRIALDVGAFATRLHEINSEYIMVTRETQPSLEFITAFEVAQAHVSGIDATEQITSLQETQRILITQRNQLVTTTSDLESVPQVERSFDRELRRAIAEIRTLAANFDSTITVLSDVINKLIRL